MLRIISLTKLCFCSVDRNFLGFVGVSFTKSNKYASHTYIFCLYVDKLKLVKTNLINNL